MDALQEEPAHKWMVVAPSMSPENSFRRGEGITAGTTMDNQLVFDVFSNLINAAAILHTDKSLADTVTAMRNRLPPMQIGQYGQLQEWLQDLDLPRSTHRHVSHLYGLFPSNQVSPYQSPELFAAARTALLNRGDKSTGWSMGWKVNLWARLQDGNKAYKLIADQLNPAPKETKGQQGGTYPNLLDAHPPFQIDGNFGCTSGIVEMLLQSHDGAVQLLPALPDNWPAGKVKGLMARGGYAINMEWENHRLVSATITSALGGNCRIRSYQQLVTGNGISVAKGGNPNPFFITADIKAPLSVKPLSKPENIKKVFEYDLTTRPGQTYTLKFK
ncbi:hypothetical protein F0L74_27010 [Chitinophaga agrisoli]|uniref:Glycosyl hydrolase family 65 n=1 Tax=Chitinophaga agrisoli TaxID=2607653 RepID=A0A5B2VP38_9BACT|nr:hypothetical protein [Chitinophaga agrisoli]KAA2239839.1 hypothetical protein F0L74_27010 [Chitinophaga agrisoli]